MLKLIFNNILVITNSKGKRLCPLLENLLKKILGRKGWKLRPRPRPFLKNKKLALTQIQSSWFLKFCMLLKAVPSGSKVVSMCVCLLRAEDMLVSRENLRTH